MTRLPYLLLLILFLEIWFCVQSTYRVFTALSARERVSRYEQELHEYRQRYDQYLSRLHYVRSDRFVEDAARTDLGWSKENERIFVVSEQALPSLGE